MNTANDMARYVRVKSIRNGKYVEFEFSVLDAELTIELIMPFQAFSEFCEEQNATVILPEGPIEGLEVANPSDRQAGLYRQPHQHSFPNG
jgi:phenol hydroxylase P0 protein